MPEVCCDHVDVDPVGLDRMIPFCPTAINWFPDQATPRRSLSKELIVHVFPRVVPTVRVAVPVIPPDDAVIVVVPAAREVIKPL